MINDKDFSPIRDGVSQNDRFLAPLKEGYVHVDEMGFEALLCMSADLAGILTFYNAENERDGTWAPLFTADQALLMAMILGKDLKYIERAYMRLFTHGRENLDTYYLALSGQSYKLAQSIDFWFTGLVAIEEPIAWSLSQEISSVIQKKLIVSLHSLGDFLSRYESVVTQKYGIDFHSFNRIWKIEENKEKRLVFSKSTLPSLQNRTVVKNFLKSNFYTFFDAIVYLKKTAAAHLPDVLESGTHKPAVGLYIAFLKLFQKVKEKINCFTQNHRHFYYDQVLQIKSRLYVPDSTYLVFEPDGHKKEVLIQKGTKFTAGKDENGAELIYVADDDLLINRAKVTDLLTLSLERTPLISPERELGYVTGIRTTRIPVSDAASAAENGTQNVWPLFGVLKTEAQRPLLKDAPIGFAVASSVLLLKEGDRNLQIYVRIDYDSNMDGKDLSTVIKNIAQTIETTKEDAFQKLFGKIFRIELTTESGWVEVPEYVINHCIIDDTCPKDCLRIQFRLRPEVAPITPYEPEVHGDRFDTNLPILRMVINPDAYIYPYSLLKDLLIREIEIHTDVRGVKDILLYNTLGQLDPNTPFQPFGPAPAVGSYVVVGNFEAARKAVTSFEVNFDWDGLPLERGGFGVKYQAYGMPFDEALFEARVSVLRDGRWYPQNTEEQPRVKLFVPGSTGEALSSVTPPGIVSQVTLKTGGIVVCRPISSTISEEVFACDIRAKDGFYKFTLSAPEYAFGHREYPLILSTILIENARVKKLRQAKPVPNPPYTPVVSKISINYLAKVIIDMEKERSRIKAVQEDRVFHLHPLGIERIFPATKDVRRHLLPQYHWDGNLFIGLSAPEVFDVVTLFFHLRDDSMQGMETKPLEIQWLYLVDDQWKPLERSRIISDTTNGFLSSGIVTLHIPGDITMDNTLMPADLYWLRVSAKNHLKTVCSLYSVKAQAMKVSWENRGNSFSHLKTGLPAGTIKEPKISIPEIKTITQIVDSFGGKPEESRERLETRISERLKHKSRAATPWDYERLILQQYPEIFKVKCFSCMSTLKRPLPGHLLIAVIPRHQDATAIHLPSMANSYLLKEIKAYVEKLSSPFAEIEVRNPAYERIQVRCTVKFTQGLREGYYINKLNQAISTYLSPWTSTGYQTGFGWCIRRSDLVPYIQGLDYIHFVTDFSMLRIAGDSESGFTLFDTVGQPPVARDSAKNGAEPEQNEIIKICPQVPWSIALPVKRHFIEITKDFKAIKPEVTGIDELEVGNTFIITT